MAFAALFFVWATIVASAKTRSTSERQDSLSCEPGCKGQCFEGKCLFLPENIDNEDAINTVLEEHHVPTSLAATQQSNRPLPTGPVATQQSDKPQLIASVANHEDLLAPSSNTSNTTANPANAVHHFHARQSKLHGLIAALEQAPLASEDKEKLAKLIQELDQEEDSPQKVIEVGDRLQALVEQLKNKTVMVASKPEAMLHASNAYTPSNKFWTRPMLLSHGVERDYHQSSLTPGLRILPGTAPTQYGGNFGPVHRSPVDWRLAQSYERLKDQFRTALKTENLLLMENKALRKLLVARGPQQPVEGAEPQAGLLARTAGSLMQRVPSQAFNLGPINLSLLLIASILMTLLCRWWVKEGSKEINVPRFPQIFPHALIEGVLRRAGFRYYVLEITGLQIGDLPVGGAVHVTVSVDGGETYTSQVPSHGADGATLTFPDTFKFNVKTRGNHSSCTFEVSDDDLGSGVAKTVIPAPKLLECAHLKYGEYFNFELTPDSRIVVQDGDDAKKPYVAMSIRDVSDEPGRGVAMSSIV